MLDQRRSISTHQVVKATGNYGRGKNGGWMETRKSIYTLQLRFIALPLLVEDVDLYGQVRV